MDQRKRDRRVAPRYRIDAAIRVNDQTALAIDLSVGGVFFETTEPLDVGQPVELLLPYEHTGPGARLRAPRTS